MSHYQIAVASTGELIEPDTYYPSREQAEHAKARIEATTPELAGKLIVVADKDDGSAT
jgi:hypothetical protein